jgi:hypothetical protein
LIVEF